MIIIALAAGIIGTVISLALRRNTTRARSWETAGGLMDERFVYLTLPGFSLLMLGVGAVGLVQPLTGGEGFSGIIGMILLAVVGAVALAGLVISVWGLFASSTPHWALPAWKKKP